MTSRIDFPTLVFIIIFSKRCSTVALDCLETQADEGGKRSAAVHAKKH